ncbi:hypothetical protein BH09ACT8_BH09ACT8_24940 [soil metagenome]
MDSGIGDGNNNTPPWASVFDATANSRALSAIQTEGFRAASELVDRCVNLAAASLGGIMPSGPSANADSIDHRTDILGATNIEPLIRGWWSMVGQYVLGSAPDATPSSRDRSSAGQGAALDFAKSEAQGGLGMEATASGAAVADVWLHNAGADDFGQIRLRCSDLLADHGGVIAAGNVTFSPDTVPMPGRSSRGITIEITIADDAVAGIYRGNLLAEGHPKLWLPIVLTVWPAAS